MKITLRFTFLLLCLLAASKVLIVECAEEWWEYGHFYQIYPRSFQDSDGDGVGDLNGITTRLSYLKDLGVTGIWLSPIFKSPMVDFGYDISDYRAIHDDYGTMEDFERLAQRCKKLGIKLILDFVPNHTSDQHEWFIQSKAGNPKYKDYYVWSEGKNSNKDPPSNWRSVFQGSAWSLDNNRKQYYLHQFSYAQPDLNFRNANVVNEMKDVLRFWVTKGVDGFRCDSIGVLFENNKDNTYKDEAVICNDQKDRKCLNHTETEDLDETYDMLYQWRALLDDEFKDPPRILMSEAYSSLPKTLRYYGKTNNNGAVTQYGAQIPFNFQLLSNTDRNTKATVFKQYITDWLNNMPHGARLHANWVLGNHDNRRLASRYGPTRIDLFNILLKTLPGVAITYQGEELGLTDVDISWEDTVDPSACSVGKEHYQEVTRDPERTPFQWDSNKNAGFSTAAKTWLPLAKNYTDCNVKLQQSQLNSHLNIFRRLILLRTSATIKYGDFDIEVLNDNVLAYKREKDEVFVVLLNLGGSKQSISLKNIKAFEKLPTKMEVVLVSTQSKNHLVGDVIDTYSDIEIEGDVGVVLVSSK